MQQLNPIIATEMQQNNITIQNSCFNHPGPRNHRFLYYQYFDSYKIREERIPSRQAMLDINFKYLPLLQEWKFDKLFDLEPIVYHQLVRIFYSNVVCVKNQTETETIGIRSYLLGQFLYIDSAYIANTFGLDNEGISNEKQVLGSRYKRRDSASVIDLHERFLHLMISWWF